MSRDFSDVLRGIGFSDDLIAKFTADKAASGELGARFAKILDEEGIKPSVAVLALADTLAAVIISNSPSKPVAVIRTEACLARMRSMILSGYAEDGRRSQEVEDVMAADEPRKEEPKCQSKN